MDAQAARPEQSGPARPRRLHVLVVARLYPSHDQPGRGIFVADLVRALVAAGHSVTVASFETVQLRGPSGSSPARAGVAATGWAQAVAGPDTLAVPRSWGAGVPVARLPVVRTWGDRGANDETDRIDRHAEILLAFGRSLALRSPIDVIHAHTGAPDGLAADRLATELGVPLLVSEHDSTLPRRLADDRELADRYRRLADGGPTRAVAAVSQPLADRIRAALGSDAALEILPNPVALDDFGAAGLEGRDRNELLWVGQLAEHKGTPLLLEAFAEVRRARPAWRLRLIGPAAGGDHDRWREMARSLGIADAVSIEPRADRTRVAGAMRRASIFVHPSPWETFGVVAAEAIASGLPVAATPSGGVEWIVGASGQLGEIAAAHDAQSLAAAILAVDERRAGFDPISMRAGVAARFAPDRVAARADALYERLLGDPVGADRPRDPEPLRQRDGGGLDTPAWLVIGAHHTVLPRLAALPAGDLAGATLVTAPGDLDRVGDVPAPVRFDLDPVAAYRRRLASADGLLGRLRRRSIVRARPRIEAAERRRVLLAAASAARGPGANALAVVAVDADDACAAIEIIPDAVLTPGSLRWLADRRDALRRAGAPGRDDDHPRDAADREQARR